MSLKKMNNQFSSIFFLERQKQKKMETKLYREKDQPEVENPDETGTGKADDVFNRPANALQVNRY